MAYQGGSLDPNKKKNFGSIHYYYHYLNKGFLSLFGLVMIGLTHITQINQKIFYPG